MKNGKHLKKNANNKLIIFLILIISILIIFLPLKKVILKMIYPIKYEEYVKKYSQEYGIDELLIYSIIKAESDFKENSVSSSGAIGLMQIMEQTAIETSLKLDNTVIIKNDLFNKEINIKLGTYYFSELLKKYNGVIELAVVAYNAGSGNVDKWINQGIIKEDGSNIENVPFKETNIYVRKILGDYDIYKKLWRKE